jgi:hypothetical protein
MDPRDVYFGEAATAYGVRAASVLAAKWSITTLA